MKMSDIFDIPIILKDNNGHYFELEFDGYVLEQPSDFPSVAYLKKGKRITRKEALYYRG